MYKYALIYSRSRSWWPYKRTTLSLYAFIDVSRQFWSKCSVSLSKWLTECENLGSAISCTQFLKHMDHIWAECGQQLQEEVIQFEYITAIWQVKNPDFPLSCPQFLTYLDGYGHYACYMLIVIVGSSDYISDMIGHRSRSQFRKFAFAFGCFHLLLARLQIVQACEITQRCISWACDRRWWHFYFAKQTDGCCMPELRMLRIRYQ